MLRSFASAFLNEFIDAIHFEACDGLIDVLFTAYMIIRFYSSIVNGLL